MRQLVRDHQLAYLDLFCLSCASSCASCLRHLLKSQNHEFVSSKAFYDSLSLRNVRTVLSKNRECFRRNHRLFVPLPHHKSRCTANSLKCEHLWSIQASEVFLNDKSINGALQSFGLIASKL